ncbi:MAG: glycosyltransferase family 4 protein [Candidatus Eisenbacteria bacterium]|nr:glycosyltransferase family 4 protein [Candidatus Eisenbacteria bacterium]
MKILQVNKFFFLKGGAERYFFELSGLLSSRGHKIIPFSMQDPANVPSPYAKHFVSNVILDGTGSTFQKIRTAARVIYSFEARRKLEELIHEERPDIAHVHNIAHQISPSIIGLLKKHGIPVVQTLHDYKLACPAYLMIVRGRLCDACVAGKYYNVLLKRCTHDSLLASGVACAEMYVHRLTGTFSKVDAFLCPSEFIMGVMRRSGIEAQKLFHVPHFIDLNHYEPRYGGSESFIYAGRLSAEKGLKVLLEAKRNVKGFNLVVAGEGELRERLEAYATNDGDVSFMGFLPRERLAQVWRDAAFTVVPSVCYENFPYTILESFAFGKPVIAARIGGMPELVRDGENGFLVEPGNVRDLTEKILYLVSRPDEILRMGRLARETAERTYSAERHYDSIMKLYERMAR